MYTCEYYEIFKNTCFEEHLQTAASTDSSNIIEERLSCNIFAKFSEEIHRQVYSLSTWNYNTSRNSM